MVDSWLELASIKDRICLNVPSLKLGEWILHDLQKSRCRLFDTQANRTSPVPVTRDTALGPSPIVRPLILNVTNVSHPTVPKWRPPVGYRLLIEIAG